VTMWRGLDAVIRDVGNTPRRRSVVTVGVFDGVHRGHQVIVSEFVRRARALEVPAVAITFDPHPLSVVRPDVAPMMLSAVDRRAELLQEVGVDHVVVLPFDQELARQSPEEFVETVLVRGLNVSEVIVGADFRFGFKAAGDVALLSQLGDEHGFVVEGVGLVGDGRERWSSTAARRKIAEGDVRGAAAILSRPHRLDGVVVHGDHRGRELGFPTANVEVPEGIAVPADGVYAGRLVLLGEDGSSGETFPAAISVGANATFDGTQRRVEAHVLDRDDLELYDRHVGVELVERLRGMEKFDGVEALKAAVHDDISRTRALLTS
jgi:riboflavin kinase/FMN adenylyltransferase